jgi:beta-galactosidase
VMIDWRDGFWVGVNYSGKDYNVPLSPGAKFLIGNRNLKTADVVVWKE